MTTTSESTTTTTTKRAADALLSWAKFGLETAADARKQWLEIASGYGELAFQAAKDNLATMESFYSQTRKSAERIAEARSERLQAALDRLS